MQASQAAACPTGVCTALVDEKKGEAAFFVDLYYSYSAIFCSQKMLICLLRIMSSSIPHTGQVLPSFRSCTVAEFGGTWILSSNSTVSRKHSVLLTQQLILSRKCKTKSLHLPYSKWTILGTLLCTPLTSFPPFWIYASFSQCGRVSLKISELALETRSSGSNCLWQFLYQADRFPQLTTLLDTLSHISLSVTSQCQEKPDRAVRNRLKPQATCSPGRSWHLTVVNSP